MLTLFKQIFTWWNHQTLGTRLHTFFKGKFVGKDENGNKYYESKNGRRWVIYNGEVDSTKTPNEWFSWIHFTKNKIEKVQDQKKFSWQKSHKPNLTGTDEAYHPKKVKMKIKNINLGKSKILLISIFFYLLTISTIQADDLDYFGKKIDIRILDKLSSKSKLLKLDIGENFSYKNLEIKVLKCKNSKFDDNPEITTYLQVKDSKNSNNDEVFVFNGWTFSSSPSIQVFDHPVYDLWILKCY